MSKVKSFAPVLPRAPKILILGSMPSVKSLQQQQYYAHPQNAFWKILATLLEFAPDLPYPQRIAALHNAHVAVWDVLKSCERDGSLDTAITCASEKPNAIAEMLREHKSIAAVCLNGRKAVTSFHRHLQIDLALKIIELPSTSPANARLSFEQKLATWRVIKDYL